MALSDREIPEPFRYSRAHSYPQSAARYASPSPAGWDSAPSTGQRSRTVLALIAATVVLGLIGALGVAKLSGNGSTVAESRPPGPSVEQQLPPEGDETDIGSDQGSLDEGFATEAPVDELPPGWIEDKPAPRAKPKAKASPSPSKTADTAPDVPTGPPPPPPLPQILLTVNDLRPVNPGSWGVLRERLYPQAGSRPTILSCTESVDMPPHLARVFLVPASPGPWLSGGPAVIQRLREYPSGSGANAVQAIREMRNACPVRNRNGYTEEWRVMRDERTRHGDVLWYRRVPRTPDPARVDFGADWMVLRNGDVVTMVEMVRGTRPLADSGEALLAALRARTCYGGSC